MNSTARSSSDTVQLHRRAPGAQMASPPSSAAATLSRWPSSASARSRTSFSSHGAWCSAAATSTPASAAAALDPMPAADRDAVHTAEVHTAAGDASSASHACDVGARDQVASGIAAARPGHPGPGSMVEVRRRRCSARTVVLQLQRQREDVEARAEVGDAGGDGDADTHPHQTPMARASALAVGGDLERSARAPPRRRRDPSARCR